MQPPSCVRFDRQPSHRAQRRARRSVTDGGAWRRFNLGMRAFFEAGHCGPGHVVDVFNMTHALVTELGREAVPLTYDSVHWAGVVNLIKAQIVLNDIASELPDANAQPPPLRRI